MKQIPNRRNLILSGGGDEEQSFTLDSFFFSKIPNNGKILYIPIALRNHRPYEGAPSWFKGVIAKHKREDITVDILDDLTSYTGNLETYNAIYIGGGNTWSLLHEIKNSGFFDTLMEYSLDGGLVYGGSAGAIILGKSISGNRDENNVLLSDHTGFDLLYGFSVVPHADTFDHLKRRPYEQYIALTEDGGIYVHDTRIKVISGGVSIAIDDHTQSFQKGEEIDLSRL